MKKRVTSLLLAFLFTSGAFALGGCSGKQTEKKDEKKTIRFATFYSDKEQGGIYKDIARAYEKKNPNIKVEVTSNFGNEEKLKDAISGKEAYDIVGMKRNQLIEYAKTGQLTDLASTVQEKQLDAKLLGIGTAYGTYNGKQFGIGDLPVVCEWFYNKGMFQKFGLTEPSTLKELLAVSKQLKKKGITPIAIGGIDGWTLSMLFGMITAQTTGSNQFTDNYGADMEAFKKIESMNTAFGIFNDNSTAAIASDSDSINYRQSVEDFVNGKAAILPAGSYAVKLLEKVKHPGFDYSVFSKGIEMIKNPQSLFSASASQVLTVPTSSKNAKEAQAFLGYIFSEEAQKYFVEEGYHSMLKSSNTPKSNMDQLILSHLENCDGNSIMLFDNLNPTMLENLTMVLKDIVQGRVKPKEAWGRVLKFTYQR